MVLIPGETHHSFLVKAGLQPHICYLPLCLRIVVVSELVTGKIKLLERTGQQRSLNPQQFFVEREPVLKQNLTLTLNCMLPSKLTIHMLI